MAWTNITNAAVAAGAAITTSLMTALRDNISAVANGDAGAPSIKDAALDTGAATSDGTDWVNLRTADSAIGAVGTYAMLTFNVNTDATFGTTHAGADLRYSNGDGDSATPAPSGTWMLMGRTRSTSSSASTSLFLRVS